MGATALVATCEAPAPPPRLNLESLSLRPGPRGAGDEVVATVNGAPLYQSDVTRQAAATGADVRAALDELVALELLSQRAARQTFARGEEARAGLRQVLAQAYVQREIEPRLGLEAVPESLLRKAYERTRAGHVHPRLRRVALLQLFTPEKAGPQRRTQAAAWSKELEVWVARPENRTLQRWRALPQEPPWNERLLTAGVTWVPEGEAYSEALNRAIFQLPGWNAITPLVADPFGFHLAMYLGEREARNVSFEEAQPRLRSQLHEGWRQQRFLELTDELARKAGAQVAATIPARP